VPVKVARSVDFAGDVVVELDGAAGNVTSTRLRLQHPLSEGFLQVSVPDTAMVGHQVPLTVVATGVTSQTLSLALSVSARQPNAQQLIAGALRRGEIDLGTSFLYRAYAAVGDARLPSSFQGWGSADRDELLDEDITRAEPTLSAAILQQLRPFRLRPDEPGSVWSWNGPVAPAPDPRGVRARRAPQASAVNPPAPTLAEALQRLEDSCLATSTAHEISERHPFHPVRVHAFCPGGIVDNIWAFRAAQRTLVVVDQAWFAMTTLMGQPRTDGTEGGDDAIDVYLTSPLSTFQRTDAVGYTTVVGGSVRTQPSGNKSSGYVRMDLAMATSDPGEQEATVVHELFHVLQFAHNAYGLSRCSVPVTPQNPQCTGASERHWFVEASAKWAEEHFSRIVGLDPQMRTREHRARLGRFQLRTVGLAYPGLSGEFESYDAYVWPLYVELKTGSSAFMSGIWQGFEQASSFQDMDDAIDVAFPYADHFAAFALTNLNRGFQPGDPVPAVERYVSLDSAFPDGETPAVDPCAFTAAGECPLLDVTVPPLGAAYYHVTGEGNGVKQIVFDWSTQLGDGQLEVQAVIFKPDKGWEYKRFDDRSRANICVTLTGTPSLDIWFVLSNRHRQNSISIAGPTLRALAQKTPACACAIVAGDYCFTELGGSPVCGFTSSLLRRINDDGVVVGDSATSSQGDFRAATWKDGNRTLVGLPGLVNSGLGISDTGDVVGPGFHPATGLATAWLRRGGTTHNLGVLTGFPDSSAHAVNARGVIAGSVSDGLPGGQWYRAIWRNCAVDVMTGLFDCDVSTFGGHLDPVDINEDNELLLLDLSPGQPNGVSVLNLDTGASRLLGSGYLSPGGINERGTVVMNRLVSSNPTIWEALVVHADGTITVLPCPTASCAALGLNDRDEVVGTGQILWDAFGRIKQLPKTAGVSPTLGYLYGLNDAIGINNAGEIIGSGYRNGTCSGTSYLLTPLE
jgi:hypothetical protein